MKKNLAVSPILILTMAALAHSQAAAPAPGPVPTKIGIINAMLAIQGTKEGQKALDDLGKKFQPRKDALDKLEGSITARTEQLRKGAATMSPEAQKKLQDAIAADTKTFNRDREDAQAEAEDENGKITSQLGEKMMTVLSKYAVDNGYAVVLDVSPQTNQVLFAATGTDITADIVKLYDDKYPVAAAAAAPAAAPAGSAAKPAAPAARPPAAPAKKP